MMCSMFIERLLGKDYGVIMDFTHIGVKDSNRFDPYHRRT